MVFLVWNLPVLLFAIWDLKILYLRTMILKHSLLYISIMKTTNFSSIHNTTKMITQLIVKNMATFAKKKVST